MKKKINNGIFYVVISFVAVLAIGSVAAIAFVGNANRVIENVEVYQEASQPTTPVEDGNLGAVSGPDRFFPVFSDNDVQYAPISNPMQTATTTLCSIENPFNATSTLDFFSFDISTGTGTASTIVMATSTIYSATTTTQNLITAVTVAAGAQASWNYLPSGTGRGNMLAPNDYVLLMTESSGLSGYTYIGKCKAKFTRF